MPLPEPKQKACGFPHGAGDMKPEVIHAASEAKTKSFRFSAQWGLAAAPLQAQKQRQ